MASMSLSGLLLPAHHHLGTGTVSLRCSEGPWAGNHLCPRSHVILPGPPIVTGSSASRHLGDPWTCLGLSWGCRCRKPRTGLQATVTCLGQGLMGGVGKAWMSSPCSAPGPLTGKVQEISLEAGVGLTQLSFLNGLRATTRSFVCVSRGTSSISACIVCGDHSVQPPRIWHLLCERRWGGA